MRTLFLCLLAVASTLSDVFAQSGYYFQSHFTPIANKRDQVNYSIGQDDSDRLYFANRQGLLQFDGSNWDLIETPGPTFSVQEYDSTIYLAGTYGFGRLSYNVFGSLVFESLSDSSNEAGAILQIVDFGKTLAMTDGEAAFFYAPDEGAWDSVRLSVPVEKLIIFDSKLLATSVDTTFVVKGEGKLPEGFHDNGPWLLWKKSTEGQWVGANVRNELFTLDNGKVEAYKLDDDAYLAESRVLSVEWINEGLLAVGTLRGGVVFVDTKLKKVDQIVNFHTGLPDNETQTLYCDREAGLWVAHPYGYTRVSPNIPFKSYNYYPGLDGTLYSSRYFNNRVFAGTNLGLFYLDEVKNFEEIVYYIKRNPATQLTVAEESKKDEKKEGEGGILSFFRFGKGESKAVDEPASEPAEEAESTDKKKKSGLFSFLKKNKDEPAPDDETAPVVTKPVVVAKQKAASNKASKSAPKPVIVRKVKKELQSITYVYKKVKGVDGRINQLVPINDKELLAAGLAGVFIVKNDSAVNIYPEAVRSVFYQPSQNLILVSTYKGGLLTVKKENGAWKQTVLLENIDDFIQHMFEDRSGKIWLCTSQKLYWAKIGQNGLADAGEIELKNDFLDPVLGIDDEVLGVVFMHAKGFFRLNGNQLETIEWEGMQEPSKYISSAGQLLISDGRVWHRMGPKVEATRTFSFLNVFEHIVSVDFEKDGDLWVVTSDNNLYRIDNKKVFEAEYHPFLKHIRSVNNQRLPIGTKLRVEQENSSLSFVYNQTEYSGILKIEYRYRLLGLNEEWSSWSPNNSTIEFAYLPSDSYELQVETRNSFGVVKALEPVYFTVVPPYWQRPWFYAAEFLFFAFLLFLSSRLTKSDRMYVLIFNRLLTFLTIIMIIEFIQTLVEANFDISTSPVLSFFLQVGVAFCLLPLESFMRSKLSAKGSHVDDLVQSHVSKITKGIVKPGFKRKATEG